MASSQSQNAAPVTAIQHFDSVASVYEATTGGATREVAQFILELPQLVQMYATDSVILDNACGSGVVTDEILRLWRTKRCDASELPPTIHAVDPAPKMIELARAKVAALTDGHPDRVRHAVMAAEQLGFPDETFTHSVTNMGILFFNDKAAGAREIYRTLRKGGVAVVTAWKDLGYVNQVLHPAQAMVRPQDPLYQVPVPPEWFDPERIRQCLAQDGGFEQVQVQEIKVHYGGATSHNVRNLLVEAFRSAVLKDWTEAEQSRFKDVVLEKIEEGMERYSLADGNKRIGIPKVGIVAICQK